jgi:hypothetical protein
MEDCRDHRARRIVVLTIALLAGTRTTQAQEQGSGPFEPWPSTVVVSTNPDAVVVESEVHGSSGGTGTQASRSGSRCWLEPTNIGASLSEEFWNRPSNELPFFLWCDGEMVGLVWRAIGDGGSSPGVALRPEDVAMQLRDRIPIPSVAIGANPDRGLVGIESWFWIDGYDGGPIAESTEAFGRRIEVEARVERYEWSFGDNRTLRTETPGRPYPERSDVHHVYERSSLGYEKGYPVQVGFFFSVRYRVDGGGWIELPGIERGAVASYQVRESQAVIRR